MDIQVFYGKQEMVVAVIWMPGGLKKGYLLSFCDNRETPHEDRTFQYCGHEICEVIVAYRDV